MEKELQEFQTWFNMTEEEKLSHSFLNHLNKLNQSDQLKEIALNINWKSILDLFDIEFNRLEKSFTIPDNIPEIKDIKKSFRSSLLDQLKANIFYLMILELNEIIENKINKSSEINEKILNGFNVYLNQLFSIFNFQNSLVMLNERNDKKVIIKRIEKLIVDGEFLKSFRKGRSQEQEEIRVFKMIYEEYLRLKAEDKNPKFRSLCYYFGKKELKYGLDIDHVSELESFYKRFLTHKKSIPDA